MIELSLYTGGGGGVLATQHLLGWRTIGYVDNDSFCCGILERRIEEGHLDDAPIWHMDIREFNARVAPEYEGIVDVISAGFPCQPFSQAGQQLHEGDNRNLWPETLEAIRIVRPRLAFLENVPGLLFGSHGYFGTILSGLAEARYHARWCVLGASDLGAPHRRKRLWILAHAESNVQRPGLCAGGQTEQRRRRPGDSGRKAWPGSDTDGEGKPAGAVDAQETPVLPENSDADGHLHRPRHHDPDEIQRVGDEEDEGERAAIRAGGPWCVEPGLDRVAYGVANRVDRIRALGNGQVPAVAAAAFRILSQ